jgi:hypothetical protein
VGVPPRNKNFTGRADDLERLRRHEAEGKAAALLSRESLPKALQGLGGVGKTAMAIEYAWRYAADYDLVCWIRADQTALVRSTLAGLAMDLGLDPPSASGIDRTTARVLDALRRGEPCSRWLLIFDNADRPEDLLPFVPTGDGHVLITSRNHHWGSIVDTLALDVFERAESIQFMLKRVPKGLTEAGADRLAEALGDLPLALVQAGAVISEGGMAVGEYLRQLEERITRILGQGSSPEYPTSMTAAWQISSPNSVSSCPRRLNSCAAALSSGPSRFRPTSSSPALRRSGPGWAL